VLGHRNGVDDDADAIVEDLKDGVSMSVLRGDGVTVGLVGRFTELVDSRRLAYTCRWKTFRKRGKRCFKAVLTAIKLAS
jgi:hypothetical protein